MMREVKLVGKRDCMVEVSGRGGKRFYGRRMSW
jgi:hypothetical protein